MKGISHTVTRAGAAMVLVAAWGRARRPRPSPRRCATCGRRWSGWPTARSALSDPLRKRPTLPSSGPASRQPTPSSRICARGCLPRATPWSLHQPGSRRRHSREKRCVSRSSSKPAAAVRRTITNTTGCLAATNSRSLARTRQKPSPRLIRHLAARRLRAPHHVRGCCTRKSMPLPERHVKRKVSFASRCDSSTDAAHSRRLRAESARMM